MLSLDRWVSGAGKGAVNPSQLSIDRDKMVNIADAIGLKERCWRSVPKIAGDVQPVERRSVTSCESGSLGGGNLTFEPVEQALQVAGKLPCPYFALNARLADLFFPAEE